jgi:hypothetical protein
LVGVRDLRIYLVALCSMPFIESLGFGQTEGVLALGLALAWRNRDSWVGGLVVGALIAAKLLAWPLVLWFLLTRRIRGAAVAVTSGVAFLGVSWAAIGFHGITSYPQLLSADTRAFEHRTFSVMAGVMHLGGSELLGLAVTLPLALGLLVLMCAARSDRSRFAAAVALGILSSPLLWMHYVALLLVPLAVCRPRLDRVWLMTVALWILPVNELSGAWQVGLVLLGSLGILMSSLIARESGEKLGSGRMVVTAFR